MPQEMPEDFAFSVSFGVGSKNKVSAGTANAELTFSNTEMHSIYEKMSIGDTNRIRHPYGEDKWLVRVNGHEKKIEWSGQYCEETKDAKKLAVLRIFIFEIVKGKEGYKKLPEPRWI